MILTIALFLSLVAFVLIAFLLWGWLLRLGLRLTRTHVISWRDIFSATAISLGWSIFVALAFKFLLPQNDDAVLLEDLLKMAISVLGALFVIHLKFQTGAISSFVAWLPTNLCGVVVLLFWSFIFVPFLFECFRVPTGSMAPTLIGSNHQSRCPICNETCKCTAFPNTVRLESFLPAPMICENFHISSHADIPGEIYGGDCFVATKFLSPRRWDLMVFQHPENPEQVLVKRLVGLPGETIHVENGVVHANGRPIELPKHLASMKYEPLPQKPIPFPQANATWDNPALLAEDEFFVLGDFSVRALDSRYWKKGSVGHNPYAVPKSHIIGVATHRFGAWDRWGVLWQ